MGTFLWYKFLNASFGGHTDGVEYLVNSFTVDYITLRETTSLKKVSKNAIFANTELIILAAAKIGDTRLIDNIKFHYCPVNC